MQGAAGAGAPRVETDEALIELWLRGRQPSWRAVDRASVERFLAFVGRPLGQVTVSKLQAFEESLNDLTPAPRARAQTAIVGLLRLGRQVGYLPRGLTGRRLHPR